jgi:hypothetical protein
VRRANLDGEVAKRRRDLTDKSGNDTAVHLALSFLRASPEPPSKSGSGALELPPFDDRLGAERRAPGEFGQAALSSDSKSRSFTVHRRGLGLRIRCE